MVNKKGYLKTIEAVIAIVLILVFIVSIWPKSQEIKTKTPRDIELTLDRILNEFQYNPDYRGCILLIYTIYSKPEDLPSDSPPPPEKSQNECYYYIDDFINENLPQALDYKMSICSVGSGCIPLDVELNLPKEDIYTKSAFISASLKDINPKTIKVYIWRKA